MSDLEAPLLVTAEPPRASRFSSWLKKGLRLSTPAALASPDDAHAHLHAAAVSSRVGGTAAAAVANLSNTIIGAGVMALPHVFKVLGVAPASALLLTAALLTHLSINLLLRASVVSGKSSFADVVSASLGPRGGFVCRTAVVVNNLGGLVVFLIIIGDVLSGRGSEPGLLAPLGQPWSTRHVAVGIAVLFLHTPLCMLRRVDSLKFTSALSMSLSFLFISITLTLLVHELREGRVAPINWFPATGTSLGDVLKTLPIVLTAYVCHYNIHPVFAEMAAPSEPRMRGATAAALTICTSVYWIVGTAAYALFGWRTADDVLMNFGRDLNLGYGQIGVSRVVKTGYAVALSCTFPLIQFALRQSIFDLAGWGDAALPSNSSRFVALTTFLLFAEYTLAMAVPNITVAFGVIGSTVAVLIAFILPALVGAKGTTGPTASWGRALLVVGIAFGVTSFSAVVYGMVHPEQAARGAALFWFP